MKRQRLIDIIVTASVSALIAFLQAILVGLTATGIPGADPTLAGAIAVIIKSAGGIIRTA